MRVYDAFRIAPIALNYPPRDAGGPCPAAADAAHRRVGVDADPCEVRVGDRQRPQQAGISAADIEKMIEFELTQDCRQRAAPVIVREGIGLGTPVNFRRRRSGSAERRGNVRCHGSESTGIKIDHETSLIVVAAAHCITVARRRDNVGTRRQIGEHSLKYFWVDTALPCQHRRCDLRSHRLEDAKGSERRRSIRPGEVLRPWRAR